MNVTEIQKKYLGDESMEEFRKRLEKGTANKGKIDAAIKKLDSQAAKYESLANELVSLSKEINKGYNDLRNLGGDNFGLPGKMAKANSKIKTSLGNW